jgi:hypothetical protein
MTDRWQPGAVVVSLVVSLAVGCPSRPAHAGTVTPAGAYSTSFDIETPAYRGIAPQLSIEYNSQAGNGMQGVGWSLRGLSEIHLTSLTGGAPRNTSTDVYQLDGIDLIPCTAGSGSASVANSPSCKYALPAPLQGYTARIESFRRVAFDPSITGGRWLIWNKDGSKRTYTRSRDVAEWNIAEVVDVNGNRVSYAYTQQVIGASPDYLDEITYNQTSIKCYWETRSDLIGFAAEASEVILAYRLKSIDIKVEGTRLRSYAFQYAMSSGTKRSTLVKIDTFGTNATVDAGGNVSGASLPPTTMVYADKLARNQWKVSISQSASLPTTATVPALPNQYQNAPDIINLGVDAAFLVGDFDGDGRTDALVLNVIEDPAVAQVYGTVIGTQRAKLNTHVRLASQIWVDGEVPFDAPAHWGDPVSPPFDGRSKLVKAWVADVNGDGLDDLVLLGWNNLSDQAPYSGLQFHLNAALSNGDGTFALAQPQFSVMPWTTAVV